MNSRVTLRPLFYVGFAFLLSACLPEDKNDSSNKQEQTPSVLQVDVPAITNGSWYRPAVKVSWQWQLKNEINTTYNVEIYDVDLFDTSNQLIEQFQVSGKKVICYFSAGSYENWRSDENLFEKSTQGKALDDWPGEKWLDIRQPAVHEIMKKRLDLAQQKGCDGVEPDNMDAYDNDSGFSLTANDQLAYNRFIANQAHTRNLSVGLKNDLNQIDQLLEYYDFAVNEQCFEYDECNTLKPFIDNNKPVLNAEYKETYKLNSSLICDDANQLEFSSLILPLNLDDEFRIACHL